MKRTSLTAIIFILAANGANAVIINQWASYVDDYSSQWSSSGYSANQVIGSPDTFTYGDHSTAWAMKHKNGKKGATEFIEVSFLNPVYSIGALIRETYGNGFVTQVEARDVNDIFHIVWQGVDTSPSGQPFDFIASWAETSYLVDGLRITIDPKATSTWEEIDAIGLRSNSSATNNSTSVPDTGNTIVLFGLGLLCLIGMRRRLTK